MKNKVIVICVILAVMLSFMTLAAVLAQKTGNVKTSDETVDTAEKEEFITFSFYGVPYTVLKGTTFRNFINDQAPEGFTIEEYRVYTEDDIGDPLDTLIDADMVIQDGVSYDDNLIHIDVDGVECDFSPGSSFRSYDMEVCPEYAHDVYSFYGGGILTYSHTDHTDCLKHAVHIFDPMIDGHIYMRCPYELS